MYVAASLTPKLFIIKTANYFKNFIFISGGMAYLRCNKVLDYKSDREHYYFFLVI
jgi:F0F1-type ATP synthase epsilon subunit